jgi:hypothetical protein
MPEIVVYLSRMVFHRSMGREIAMDAPQVKYDSAMTRQLVALILMLAVGLQGYMAVPP